MIQDFKWYVVLNTKREVPNCDICGKKTFWTAVCNNESNIQQTLCKNCYVKKKKIGLFAQKVKVRERNKRVKSLDDLLAVSMSGTFDLDDAKEIIYDISYHIRRTKFRNRYEFSKINGIINLLGINSKRHSLQSEADKLFKLLERRKDVVFGKYIKDGLVCPFCRIFLKANKEGLKGGRSSYVKSIETVCPKCGYTKGDKATPATKRTFMRGRREVVVN